MVRRASRNPRRLRPRLTAIVLATAIAALLQSPTGAFRRLDPGAAAFGSTGARAERGYFSQFPWERIDPVTGDLSITFTDLVLPGNAGLDVRISRSYSWQRNEWRLSFVAAPIAIYNVNAPTPPEEHQPTLVTADGSHQRLFTGVSGFSDWVTSDFTKVDLDERTVSFPNGWVATYASPVNNWAWLETLEDQYGNSVEVDWGSSPNYIYPESVTQTVNDGGGSRTRVVEFAPDGATIVMSYDSRNWTYANGFKDLTPPAGPTWQVAKTSSTLTVTTPSNGTVQYSFQELEEVEKVVEIATGGSGVDSGTWEFAYSTGAATTTTVTLPSGRSLVYVHDWDEDGPDGKMWTLRERRLMNGSTELFKLERSYSDVTFFGSKVLKVVGSQTITQDAVEFETAFGYNSGNFKDYLQPYLITESASNHSATRQTSRTFTYFTTGIHLLPRVASQTVTIGSESIATSMAYESSTGFLTSQTAAGITTYFARDNWGNLASVTDPHNHVTATTYMWGVPYTTTTPEYTITRSINEDGSVASETQNGKTTSFSYDDAGRIVSVTPATGSATTTSYASNGQSVTVTRGSSWATTTVDGFGRPIATENVLGIKTTTTYNEEGHRTFQSAPFTGSSGTGNDFEYDALGRVITIIHADNSEVNYSYSGTSVTITDELNRSTTQNYQAFGSPAGGRLASVVDGDAQTWNYSYNVAGSLTLVDPPSSAPNRSWTYNSSNQLTSETQPESGTTTYTYDSAGLLASKTDARSVTSSYSYDANHRLVGITAPSSAESVAFEYDDSGNQTRMITGGLESLFTYDNANRLTTRVDKINGKSFTTTYEYDGRDNLTKITYPSGRIAQYDYDYGNRITKVYAGSTTYAEDLTYHPTGALSAVDFGNGTSESLTLNSRFRPAHLTSGPLDITYAYDYVGNVTSIDDARSGFDASYSYDNLDRLTAVTGYGATSFSYDAQGNRLTKGSGETGVSYTYNSSTNRLTSASSSVSADAGTFGYDNAGNMTSDYHSASGRDNSFTYTSRNMMKTATVGGVTAAYEYDAAGMRAVKSLPGNVRYYIHGLGSLLLAEYDATGGTPVLAREYIYLGSKLLASFTETVPTSTVNTQLTAPLAGTVTAADAAVSLTAEAALTGSGSISSVQFYANGILVGSDSSAPYAATWTPTVAGSYKLTSRAVASTGKVANSVPAAVTVTATGRVLGVSVSPSGPQQGQTATVTVTGNAYSCGAVQVNFGDGTVTTYNHSGSLSSSPLQVTHSWSTTGAKTVTATGQGDCLGSSNTGITVAGNTAPTVSMTAPTASSVHTTGAAITLTASASDAQGIASVEFYDGSTLLHTDTASPWTYNWTSAGEGSHTIKAKAFDTLGASTESSTVSITVQDVESVSVSANPVAGQAALVTVYGAASGCGAVQVNYGQGEPTTYAIDGLPVSNYLTWTTGGQKTITATGQGNCSGSAETKITVNSPPSVSLTAPSNSDTFYAPATVNMTATASDSDGSVASVKFYAGSTLLHTDTSSPYSYSWSGMSNGNYSITAVATDNQGATTTSSAASITIADPAASTVTGVSVSQSSVAVNTSVTVTVTGGNPCGAVQINFNDGNAPYLPIDSLPYQTTHSWSSAGTYTITATGQGNCGGQASTQITITSPPGPSGPSGPLGPSRTPEPNTTFGMPAPLAAPVTVTLDIAAGANGTVTSSPSGFNCTGNDTTCTTEFEGTTTVTLTATPGSGNTFLGWGGACSGTATCETSATAGQLVTASFGSGSSPAITYYHTDVLGSVRAITDGSGETVTRHDYFAFGESSSSLEGDPRKFAGAPRDSETTFDYLQARYYRSLWGRLTTPDDSIYSDRTDPQTFNLYVYVMNNPLRWVDPSGHQAQLPCSGSTCGTMVVTVDVTASACSAGLFGCGVDAFWFGVTGILDFFAESQRRFDAYMRTLLTGTEVARSFFTQDPIADMSRDTARFFVPQSPEDVLAGIEAFKLMILGVGPGSSRAVVGRRGNPMTVASGTNGPATIAGRRYTGHALDQMQGRGIPPSAVEDAIRNGNMIAGRDGAQQYMGDGFRVVVNPDGSVKTVIHR